MNHKVNILVALTALIMCGSCTRGKNPTTSDTSCNVAGDPTCGVLSVTIPEKEFSTVKGIRVTSDQMKGDSAVVLTCKDEVNISGSETFQIAIPARSYDGLVIEVSANGTTYSKCMATKDVNPICIEAGKTTSIQYATNAVRLWAGSPYWSTMNLGETMEQGNTCTYAWSDSIVTAIWGKNWCMPEKEDMDILMQKPTYETCGKVGGWAIYGTANTEYAENKIFLPSIYSDSFFARASYFTGTEFSREQAWLAVLTQYGDCYRRCWNQGDKIFIIFIRPVLSLN